MAANIETHSNEKELRSPQSSVNQHHRGGTVLHLDERRKSALANIDNASFSLVLLFSFLSSSLVLTSHLTVGSMSKSSVSLALASLPMRK